MGLMDLEGMDVPDNKGGRPPKEEEEEESRRTYGRAYTGESCDEDWWLEVMEESIGTTELAEEKTDERREQVVHLADYTALFPIEVRGILHELELMETDWEWLLAHNPHLMGDSRLPEDWYKATQGVSYSIRETFDIQNGEQEPFWDRVKDPDKIEAPTSQGEEFLAGLMDDGDDDDEGDNEEPSSGLGALLSDAKGN